MNDGRTLIAHVVYRFAVGGLENGMVNLINRMPRDRWRHVVIALTSVSESFRARIQNADVEYYSLEKPPGHGWRVYGSLFRLFRRLQPDIVHTRNLAALEAMVPAWLARVPVRIHGEHGRDVTDLDGMNRRHQLVRISHRPLVHCYVALSRDLESYLVNRIGVPATRVHHLYNGVDTTRFHPSPAGRTPPPDCPFGEANSFIFGTVGRMEKVKDQATLARAFLLARQKMPNARLRLVFIGDGPCRSEIEAIVRDAGAQSDVWFAGERSDIPQLLRGIDCFVLPSLAEGISNTLLEAMATAIPVIATRVGANADLMENGAAGALVPSGDPVAMAAEMLAFAEQVERARACGAAGRAIVERRFSLDRMVAEYETLYREQLGFVLPARDGGVPARHRGENSF